VSLEGWVPEIGEFLSLEEVIEHAFDYRGNTTVVKQDGTEIVGYVFNRDRGAPDPFIQLFDEDGDGPHRILYADIVTIRFTGRDAAAGNSWKAWIERRQKDKAEPSVGSDAGERAEPPHPHGG
jgi:hypothetical protein